MKSLKVYITSSTEERAFEIIEAILKVVGDKGLEVLRNPNEKFYYKKSENQYSLEMLYRKKESIIHFAIDINYFFLPRGSKNDLIFIDVETIEKAEKESLEHILLGYNTIFRIKEDDCDSEDADQIFSTNGIFKFTVVEDELLLSKNLLPLRRQTYNQFRLK